MQFQTTDYQKGHLAKRGLRKRNDRRKRLDAGNEPELSQHSCRTSDRTRFGDINRRIHRYRVRVQISVIV